MEKLHDLETFAKNLIDKGYNGYFHTQGAYPGRLKDSMSEYLENCQRGVESLPKGELLLTTYLQWTGEDKPRVQCCMWVQHHNGKFDLQKMEITKKDQFGQLLKQSELTNLTMAATPQAKEAVAMVSGELRAKVAPRNKRFGL